MDATVGEDTKLVIRRSYAAPLARVWDAWTKPRQMSRWMGPPDAPRPAEVSADLRVGGRYRIVMYAASGETHRVGGTYREIEPRRKLVYTWAWESTPERESLVTVEFLRSGEGTDLLLTHERFADRDARDRHGAGWTACLDRLARSIS
jgi:uncharacterized protein YndB with AHSA1/START domain